METSAFANWLNTAFASFDGAILDFYHNLAVKASGFFTPVAEFFDVIGEGALFCFVLAAVLLFFKKTRIIGVCIIGAVCCGALITNLTIKELVARPRPFNSDTVRFWEFWQYIGAPEQSKYSFPSGHTTSAVAGMLAICLTARKKWVIAPAAAYAVIMGATRNYLMVHYPTDVIAGFIVGSVAAVIAFFIVKFIWKFLDKHRDIKPFNFILEFDIRNLFKKKSESNES